MKCHRCDAEIDEGADDDVETLLIRQLLHDRDGCAETCRTAGGGSR